VYLRASVPVLMRRITKRGRGIESSISEEYVAGLNRLYEEWATGFDLAPVLVVPVDSTDFVENPGDLARILSLVEERLQGAQEPLFPGLAP
jgi:deoxyadenosine/deoxycytidine kinase